MIYEPKSAGSGKRVIRVEGKLIIVPRPSGEASTLLEKRKYQRAKHGEPVSHEDYYDYIFAVVKDDNPWITRDFIKKEINDDPRIGLILRFIGKPNETAAGDIKNLIARSMGKMT